MNYLYNLRGVARVPRAAQLTAAAADDGAADGASHGQAIAGAEIIAGTEICFVSFRAVAATFSTKVPHPSPSPGVAAGEDAGAHHGVSSFC